MSGRRSKTIRSKKKKMKKTKKKKFLLASKKCWVIDEKLLPFYQHLVDDYSVKLREEWTVKVEETDIEATPQVKEEPLDDYLVYHPTNEVQNSTNHEVINPLLFSYFSGG